MFEMGFMELSNDLNYDPPMEVRHRSEDIIECFRAVPNAYGMSWAFDGDCWESERVHLPGYRFPGRWYVCLM